MSVHRLIGNQQFLMQHIYPLHTFDFSKRVAGIWYWHCCFGTPDPGHPLGFIHEAFPMIKYGYFKAADV